MTPAILRGLRDGLHGSGPWSTNPKYLTAWKAGLRLAYKAEGLQLDWKHT